MVVSILSDAVTNPQSLYSKLHKYLSDGCWRGLMVYFPTSFGYKAKQTP